MSSSRALPEAIRAWLRDEPDAEALTALLQSSPSEAERALIEVLTEVSTQRSWADDHLRGLQSALLGIQQPRWLAGGHVYWPGRGGQTLKLHVGQLAAALPQGAGTDVQTADQWVPAVAGTEPWSSFGSQDVDSVLSVLGVHDSSMRGVWFDPWTDSASLFIELDLFWNPFIPKTFRAAVMRFTRIFEFTWSGGASPVPTIMQITSRPVDTAEREGLLLRAELDSKWATWGRGRQPHPATEAAIAITKLDTVVGETLTILHVGEAQVLLIDTEGRWAAPIPVDGPSPQDSEPAR